MKNLRLQEIKNGYIKNYEWRETDTDKMKKKNQKEALDDALFKKAIGFTAQEVSEEYNIIDNELTLSKKKTNTKTYPPDLSAIELMLEQIKDEETNDYNNYTLEELGKEKTKLLQMLEEAEKKYDKKTKQNN